MLLGLLHRSPCNFHFHVTEAIVSTYRTRFTFGMCDGRVEMVWKEIVGFGGGDRKPGPAYLGPPMHEGGEA
jgi:hypothetical protein